MSRLVFRITDPATPAKARAIEDLYQTLASRDIECQILSTSTPPQGAKSVAVELAVSLATLGVTTLATVLQLVSAWQTRNERFSVTVIQDQREISIAGLSRAELEECIANLDLAEEEEIVVAIAHGR